MTISNYSYKFQFIGEEGLYNLQISDDTLMYRLIFPNSKYVTGSSIAILNARESNELNEYEGGLIVNWIYDILSSFEYSVSAKLETITYICQLDLPIINRLITFLLSCLDVLQFIKKRKSPL